MEQQRNDNDPDLVQNILFDKLGRGGRWGVAPNSNLCDYFSINIKATYQDLVQIRFNVTSIYFPIMKTGSWVPFTNKKMQRNCSFYVGGCFLHPTSLLARPSAFPRGKLHTI